MALKGMCPDCGLAADLHVFALQSEVNPALAEALQVPASLGSRVTAYLRLFNPPRKAMSHRKAQRLLAELRAAVDAGQVERHGRSWPAPIAYWQLALDELLAKAERLQLPLKSHGYLFEMVAGLANKAEARGEAEREAERRRPPEQRPVEDGRPAPVSRAGGRPTDALIEREMARLRQAQQGGSDGD